MFRHVLTHLWKAISLILSFIGHLLTDAFFSLADSLTKPKGFSAAFGSETDIANRFNKGFLISRHRKLTRRKSFENVLLAGPTGSGKTTRLLLKMLFELKNCTIIINDPSKELYFLASGYLSQFFRILTLNFSDSTVSSGYNILSRIKNSNDINKVADLLIRATIDKNASDPFWGLQSRNLLVVFIRLIRYQSQQYQNMANVLHLVNLFATQPTKVDELVVRTRDKKLILDYKAIVAMPSKTLMNIVASVKAALQIFEDEQIAKVTAADTINFEEFREKPTLLFLHNNIGDMKYVNTLQSLFFEQFYNYLLSRLPKKDELDIFIIIEEASSLYIPGLPVYIANTRKHRVGNVICLQTPNQLNTFYKEDTQNIVSNCVTKIFLPGQTDLQTMRDIEVLSGKAIYKDDKGVERVKPLITVDEIRLLDANRTLILSGNTPLIKGRTTPYYKSWRYKALAKHVPITLTGDIPNSELPLIAEHTDSQDVEEEA